MKKLSQIVIFVLVITKTQYLYADFLEQYEWVNRPLLIFSDNHNSAQYQAIVKNLERFECDLADRRMVQIHIFTDTGFTGTHQIAHTDVLALRQRFNVQPSVTFLILIGYDGEEKYRSTSDKGMAVIFDLVDSMPMRQQEMKYGTTSC